METKQGFILLVFFVLAFLFLSGSSFAMNMNIALSKNQVFNPNAYFDLRVVSDEQAEKLEYWFDDFEQDKEIVVPPSKDFRVTIPVDILESGTHTLNVRLYKDEEVLERQTSFQVRYLFGEILTKESSHTGLWSSQGAANIKGNVISDFDISIDYCLRGVGEECKEKSCDDDVCSFNSQDLGEGFKKYNLYFSKDMEDGKHILDFIFGSANHKKRISTAILIDREAPLEVAGLTAVVEEGKKVKLFWNPSYDLGSGIKKYKIYRKIEGEKDFTIRATTQTNYYVDDLSANLEKINKNRVFVSYFVEAADFADNASKSEPTGINLYKYCRARISFNIERGDGELDLRINASELLKNALLKVDNKTIFSEETGKTFSHLLTEKKEWDVYFEAVDGLGNTCKKTEKFAYDEINPSVDLNYVFKNFESFVFTDNNADQNISSEQKEARTISLSLEAYDNESGLKLVSLFMDNNMHKSYELNADKQFSRVVDIDLNTISGGRHILSIEAMDFSNNKAKKEIFFENKYPGFALEMELALLKKKIDELRTEREEATAVTIQKTPEISNIEKNLNEAEKLYKEKKEGALRDKVKLLEERIKDLTLLNAELLDFKTTKDTKKEYLVEKRAKLYSVEGQKRVVYYLSVSNFKGKEKSFSMREEIKKEIAENISDLVFSKTPKTIKKDPVVLWNFRLKKGEKFEVKYAIKDASRDKAILDSTLPTVKTRGKISILNTILVIVILGLLGVLAYFYLPRDKLNILKNLDLKSLNPFTKKRF